MITKLKKLTMAINYKDFNIDFAESLLKVMTLTPAMMMIMMMRCGWAGKSVLETADVPSSATNRQS